MKRSLNVRRRKRKVSEENGVRRSLGETLKAWRGMKNVPLKVISQDLGVSVGTVCAWENGSRFPTAENLDNLSSYMGMPVCRIFCYHGGRDCR